MSRPRRLLWVAAAATVLMLVEAVTSLALWMGGGGAGPRPGRGGGAGRGGEPLSRTREIWGVARGTWVDLHLWVGVALLAVVVVHLVMHRRWIACQVRRLWAGARAPAGRVAG